MGKTFKDNKRDGEYRPKKKKFDGKKYSDIRDLDKFKEDLEKDNEYDDGYEDFERFKKSGRE